MRTDWIRHDDMSLALRLLMPENALAVEVSLVTGLRIGDVLALRCSDLNLCKNRTLCVYEHKTRKTRYVRLPKKLYEKIQSNLVDGAVYVFSGAHDLCKHRTRQAVWADIKRAKKALRIKENLSCHSARKIYAVQVYREHGLAAAQKALNHNDASTTLIYLLSELIGGEKNG